RRVLFRSSTDADRLIDPKRPVNSFFFSMNRKVGQASRLSGSVGLQPAPAGKMPALLHRQPVLPARQDACATCNPGSWSPCRAAPFAYLKSTVYFHWAMQKITYASLGSLGEDFHRAFEDALQHVRDKLGGTYPIYIEGKAKRSKAGTFADTTPADTSVLLGKFQRGSREDARRAVAAAKAVYPAWRDLGWEHRVALL